MAALARFEAGAAGLPFALVRLDPGELPQDGVFAIEDIAVQGQGPVTAVRRLEPDVALIHAHAADIHGNVQMDLEAHADFARDLALARASRHVIVSVEQIVSPQAIAKAPRNMVLAATEVDCVVEAPYGAYPLACENRYDTDNHVIGSYAEAMSGTADGFRTWLHHEVRSLDDHAAYLNRLGMRRLQAVTIRRSVYA
ncbi:CoA-transferase [Neorhizobium alkalisoli]|uniref:CoA-transferase n=1 Tax=Neorhizobium alkalisoli TaxID=528178 RepID=UPI0016443403|nr:CoA-transferase [Neorhizobium alkalisoli]